jgi:hypothetical protein
MLLSEMLHPGIGRSAFFQLEMNDDHFNVSLNMLRLHQILRPNESFHADIEAK